MTKLAMVIPLAFVWVLGSALMVGAGVERRHGLLDPVGFVAGAVALYLAVVAELIVSGGVSLAPIYGLLAIAVIGASARIFRGRLRARRPRLPRAPAAIAMLGLTALLMAIFAFYAGNENLRWDGWAIWQFKAVVLQTEHRLPASILDSNGPYAFQHPDYPIGLPVLSWWVGEHVRAEIGTIASLVGVATFAVLLLEVWVACREVTTEALAATVVLGTATSFPYWVYAIGGYADHLVALALFGAIVELGRATAGNDRGALWRSVIFVAFGVSAKDEGLALAVVFCCVAAFAMRRSQGHWSAALPLAGVLGAAVPWLYLLRVHGTKTRIVHQWGESGVLAPHGGNSFVLLLSAAAHRLPGLANGLQALWSDGRFWPIPVLIVLGLWTAAKRPSLSALVPWALLLAYLIVVLLSYLFLSGEEIHWLLRTSSDRVFAVFAPAAVYAALRSIQPAGTPPITKATTASAAA